jgi:hypothetical protein
MVDSPALSLLSVYASYARQRLIKKTVDAQAVQERFLLKLLNSHKNTVLGRAFNLAGMATVDAFRQQVPVQSYAFYQPYTDRIAQGESRVLNPDPVAYINLTSGSTGNKKRVPVTRYFQRTLRRADLASIGFAIAALKERQQTFGKALLTNNATQQGMTDTGIPFGPVSVGSIRQGKWLVDQIFSVPFQALEIDDTLARHYVCLLFALSNPNLRGWVANFPMLILRTCQYLEDYADPLLHDLRHGTLPDWLPLNPAHRDRLLRWWRAQPHGSESARHQRAIALADRIKSEGRLTPRTAWSSLSYVTTARGGTSNFYLQRFPDYFGDIPVFGGVYGTAEATFSVCYQFNTDAGILALESGFFEFVPMDQWGVEQPKTLLPHELTVGDRYRVLVTSYSGFYRYDIGDVVEVAGFYNQAPLIVFRHRYGGLLSSTTEKTTEFHVVQVMEHLQAEFNLKLEDFCITLSDGEFPARYLVNIELASGYTLDNPEQFIQRFEAWMGQVNMPYHTVRQSQVPPPRLRILPAQSFSHIRQRQVSRGMFDSQLKIPHITEDRDFLADVPIDLEVSLPMSVSGG